MKSDVTMILSPEEYESLGFPTPEATLRYSLAVDDSAGPNIVTYRRVADEECRRRISGGGWEDMNEPAFVQLNAGERGPVSDQEQLPFCFRNEYRARSAMLDLQTLLLALQTWPWSPLSIPDYRRGVLDAANKRGLAKGFSGEGLALICSDDFDRMLNSPVSRARFLYHPSSEDLARLSNARAITGIEVNAPLIDDKFAKTLACMTWLLQLDLDHSRVTSEIGSAVSQLYLLSHLDVSDSLVSDEFFLNCEAVGRVGSLAASETLITDTSASKINIFGKLRFLDVSCNQVTDSFFHQMPSVWKDLVGLNVSQTGITDDSIDLFSTFESLMELNVEFCNLSWNGLQKLRNHRSLNRLSLRGVRITVDQYSQLRESIPQCLITM